MSDKTSHWPDPQILKQAGNGESPFAEHAKKLSSVCVDFTEEEGYMTRTTTIILLDRDNNVTFVEQNYDKNKKRQELDFKIDA